MGWREFVAMYLLVVLLAMAIAYVSVKWKS